MDVLGEQHLSALVREDRLGSVYFFGRVSPGDKIAQKDRASKADGNTRRQYLRATPGGGTPIGSRLQHERVGHSERFLENLCN